MATAKTDYSERWLELRNIAAHSYELYKNPKRDRSVEDIAKESKQLRNDALKQDINLRRTTLILLFLFLGVETVLIFCFSFWQATGIFSFKLEEWSFKLLTTVTILQVTYMLQVAVKYLFPNHSTQ